MDDFRIPATNNQAVQAVRMIKSKAKVSGGFRTLSGLSTLLELRGFCDALRKNSLNPLAGLRDALTGQAWMPA